MADVGKIAESDFDSVVRSAAWEAMRVVMFNEDRGFDSKDWERRWWDRLYEWVIAKVPDESVRQRADVLSLWLWKYRNMVDEGELDKNKRDEQAKILSDSEDLKIGDFRTCLFLASIAMVDGGDVVVEQLKDRKKFSEADLANMTVGIVVKSVLEGRLVLPSKPVKALFLEGKSDDLSKERKSLYEVLWGQRVVNRRGDIIRGAFYDNFYKVVANYLGAHAGNQFDDESVRKREVELDRFVAGMARAFPVVVGGRDWSSGEKIIKKISELVEEKKETTRGQREKLKQKNAGVF